MHDRLWSPETALKRAEHTHIGSHHIVARRQDVSAIAAATHLAVNNGIKHGKPAPAETVNVAGAWYGGLAVHQEKLNLGWATLYLLQAPRVANLGRGPIDMFDEDANRMSRKDRRGVFPTVIVTELSSTLECVRGDRTNIIPGSYDPLGPDKVQEAALNRGIAVVRTSQEYI
jgi:hypothetical protein